MDYLFDKFVNKKLKKIAFYGFNASKNLSSENVIY